MNQNNLNVIKWYEQFYSKKFMEVVGFPEDQETRSQAAFVQNVLGLKPENRVLDLCCGYGRHARALAEIAGCHLVGLDLSEDYLAIASRDNTYPGVEFVHGDMRDIPFSNEFDAVINLFTSFGFFIDDAENENVLHQVRKALRPGGLFLLDYENKFYFVYNDVFQKEKYEWHSPQGEIFACENKFDIHSEREIFKVVIKKGDRVLDASGYDIRLYGLPEITKMLIRNGFKCLATWGDYDEQPCSVRSRRVIVLSSAI